MQKKSFQYIDFDNFDDKIKLILYPPTKKLHNLPDPKIL